MSNELGRIDWTAIHISPHGFFQYATHPTQGFIVVGPDGRRVVDDKTIKMVKAISEIKVNLEKKKP